MWGCAVTAVPQSSLLLDLPGGALPEPSPSKATLVLVSEMAAGKAAGDGASEGGEAASEAGETKPLMATHLPAGLSDAADTGSTILTALTSSETLPNGFTQLQKRPVLRPKKTSTPSQPRVVTPEGREERKRGRRNGPCLTT